MRFLVDGLTDAKNLQFVFSTNSLWKINGCQDIINTGSNFGSNANIFNLFVNITATIHHWLLFLSVWQGQTRLSWLIRNDAAVWVELWFFPPGSECISVFEAPNSGQIWIWQFYQWAFTVCLCVSDQRMTLLNIPGQFMVTTGLLFLDWYEYLGN